MKAEINIPKIGLGTRKGITPEFVKTAFIDYGYRHIDTAKLYENEEEIGIGLKQVLEKIPREQIFVTSKLWNEDKFNVEGALKESLKKLQLDYLDLYLIHWPFGSCLNAEKWLYKQPPLYKTWADLETCVRKGLCRHIGISNFGCQLIVDLLSYAEILPYANQIELHPYNSQRNLVNFCKYNSIIPIAYAPLMSVGRHKTEQLNILEDPLLVNIAAKYKKTVGQICLNWGTNNGHCVIPQTTKFDRLKENMDAMNFTLEKDDLLKIDTLDKKIRIHDPNIKKQYGGIPIFE